MTIGLRYAARSDIGMALDANTDSAYAGPFLLAVADGSAGARLRSAMRRQSADGGGVASAAVVNRLRSILDMDRRSYVLAAALELGVQQANDRLRVVVESDPSLRGIATTLTAMLWSGPHYALAQIGDSRAYLLRNGELIQLTRDHTHSPSTDEGRVVAPVPAATPRAAVLLRALNGGLELPSVDYSGDAAVTGDRYLLCSDGMSTVVSAGTIHEVVSQVKYPQSAVDLLIDLANRKGGPDNITCVIADVVNVGERPGQPEPQLILAPVAKQRRPRSAATSRPTPSAADAVRPSPATGRSDQTPAGFTLDGYEIFEPLGEGGAATVYRARQIALRRDVAIKVIHRRITAGSDRRRFLREVDATVRLSEHPNVVTLYDADTLRDGRPYLAMELCPGGSLADRLGREGPMPATEVRKIGIQVADAVAAAHDHGVVHRDIKPGNLLLTRFGRIALADFGIAALPIPDHEMSVTLAMTPAYAPPEVLEGHEPGVAGDIYSLAATMYALMAGRPPHAPKRDLPPIALIAHMLRAQNTPIPDIPEAPAWLMAVLRQALQPDPAKRHPSAAKLRAALMTVQ
jgi:serine/threonine protein phosphatase PrpC/tRNA A-37 threonylcarbamoyl transferase component Bud32